MSHPLKARSPAKPAKLPDPSSDNLMEILYESDPPRWAAYQIATKGYGIKTVGEAMDMIEAIVRKAIVMQNFIDRQEAKKETGI